MKTFFPMSKRENSSRKNKHCWTTSAFVRKGRHCIIDDLASSLCFKGTSVCEYTSNSHCILLTGLNKINALAIIHRFTYIASACLTMDEVPRSKDIQSKNDA
ncbi:unnamed protein product [Chrysodeixis includens]|uniref:Uncharacterized protein n=1 Tax=Chrysodeixis includens TaxID=689277 RepID=A0A9N8KT59_CHRIL|nr:unnamed protein product [Chrysodeixis includens]